MHKSKFQRFQQESFKKVVAGITLEIRKGDLFINNEKANIDGYRFKYIIASGSNAVVFCGNDERAERDIAIKLWLPNPKKGKSNITRSHDEIKKLARISHEGVARYHHSGKIGIYTYCTMDYIEGQTLNEYLKLGTIPLSRRYDMIMEILEVLRLCHEKEIYHGDLHSNNIMVTNHDEIRIIDFGTSRYSGVFSKIRDSKLMSETVLNLLDINDSKELLNLYNKKIEDYSPECVRIILKALSKVTILLNFSKHGLTENVVEDIALFMTIVPFFDLRKVVNQLFSKGIDVKYIEIFKKKLMLEICLRTGQEYWHLESSCKNAQFPASEIFQDMYQVVKERFLLNIKYSNYEKAIFRNKNEMELFNGKLYIDLEES